MLSYLSMDFIDMETYTVMRKTQSLTSIESWFVSLTFCKYFSGRLFVEASVHDEFVRRVVSHVEVIMNCFSFTLIKYKIGVH